MENFSKNGKVCQKWKILSKMKICVKNGNFSQKWKIFLESKFGLEIEFFVKKKINFIFGQNPIFFQKWKLRIPTKTCKISQEICKKKQNFAHKNIFLEPKLKKNRLIISSK